MNYSFLIVMLMAYSLLKLTGWLMNDSLLKMDYLADG